MMKSSFKFQIYFEEHIDVFEYYLGEGEGEGEAGVGEMPRGIFRTLLNMQDRTSCKKASALNNFHRVLNTTLDAPSHLAPPHF